MGYIKLDFYVNVAIKEVWLFGLQAEKIPLWQFDVVRVKGITGTIDRAGTKYTLVYKKAGRLLESPVQVSRFEPENYTIETTGITPMGGFFKSTTVMEKSSDTITHIKWDMIYRLPGWFIGVLLDKLLFERAFKMTVEKYNFNFKNIIEKEYTGHEPEGRGF